MSASKLFVIKIANADPCSIHGYASEAYRSGGIYMQPPPDSCSSNEDSCPSPNSNDQATQVTQDNSVTQQDNQVTQPDNQNEMTDSGIERLKLDEGYRDSVYRDTEGHPTAGYGHKITPQDNLNVGDPISREKANEWFRSDVQQATQDARRVLGEQYWNQLSPNRRDVLINMAYNLGGTGLSGFRRMLSAVRNGDYNTAAAEMMDSRWHRQVTNRANRLIQTMQNDQ